MYFLIWPIRGCASRHSIVRVQHLDTLDTNDVCVQHDVVITQVIKKHITISDSLVYYKVRWTVITNCDSFFITKCDTVYYKLLQVLQSPMDLLQIATGITILAYTNRYFTENSRWVPLFSCHLQLPDRIERH